MSDETPDFELDFSPEAIQKASEKKTLPDGAWLRFVVTKCETKANPKSHNVGTRLSCRALRDPKDGKSVFGPPASNLITWPFTNKKAPGHTAPDTEGLCIQFFRAIHPDFPAYPRWVNGVLYFKGEEISPNNESDCRKQVIMALLEEYKKVAKDPEALVDETFYAKVSVSEGFTNLKNICAELPEDATYFESES